MSSTNANTVVSSSKRDETHSQITDRQEQGATYKSTLITVINSIIGAGILSIPYTVSNAGIIGSFLLLAAALVLSLFGVYFLIVSAVFTKKDSYADIAESLYGRISKGIAICTLVVYELGTSTAYFVILFDQTLDLLHAWFGFDETILWTHRWWITYVVTLLFSVPLLSMRSLDNLKYTSFGAVICISLFVFISIYLGITQLIQEPLHYNLFPVNTRKLASAITIFSSALCFHTNVPKMIYELRYPSKSRFQTKVDKMYKIGSRGAILCTIIYFFVGLFAYFAFGDSVAGNLLSNFQQKGYWYLSIVKFAYALVVLFSNPVIVFPSVTVIDRLIFKGERKQWRRILESLVWCTVVWLIAILIPQLEIVFGLTGATGGILLVYVLPSFYYIAVVKKVERKLDNSAYAILGPHWFYYFAYFLIIFTLILSIISVVVQVQDIQNS